jgi:hypothetical protein
MLPSFISIQAREPQDPLATMVRELEAAIETDELQRRAAIARREALRFWRLADARAERERLVAMRERLVA